MGKRWWLAALAGRNHVGHRYRLRSDRRSACRQPGLRTAPRIRCRRSIPASSQSVPISPPTRPGTWAMTRPTARGSKARSLTPSREAWATPARTCAGFGFRSTEHWRPGPKTFDANLSQFSITDQRKASVDFSSPYFDVTQVVVTTDTSPGGASAQHRRSEESCNLVCRSARPVTPRRSRSGGDIPVEVYNTNADAKLALSTGEIDALVADLPTAFAVAGELRGGRIVGQLAPEAESVEQFGIVLDKDSPLTRACHPSSTDCVRTERCRAWNTSGWPMRAARRYWANRPVRGPATSRSAWPRSRCRDPRPAAVRRPGPAPRAPRVH